MRRLDLYMLEFGRGILISSDRKYFNNCVFWFGHGEWSSPMLAEQSQSSRFFTHWGAEGASVTFASIAWRVTAFHILEKSCKLQQLNRKKELGIKSKCLSGGKAERTWIKLLLGCTDVSLSSSALPDHSTPCLLILLSSLAVPSGHLIRQKRQHGQMNSNQLAL